MIPLLMGSAGFSIRIGGVFYYLCILMYPDVSSMYSNVSWCILLYSEHLVLRGGIQCILCILSVFGGRLCGGVGVHLDTSWYIRIHQDTPGYMYFTSHHGIHQDTLRYMLNTCIQSTCQGYIRIHHDTLQIHYLRYITTLVSSLLEHD